MKKELLLIFIVSYSILSGQNKLTLSAMGGVNYIPMEDLSQYLNSFNKSEYDKIGFSGNIKLNYKYYYHSIYLGTEFISSNASISTGIVNLTYVFETIPITIGYEYYFIDSTLKWLPYLGIGLIYAFHTNEFKYFGDDGTATSSLSDNHLGFETHFGIEHNLIQNLKFVAELKYRYLQDILIDKYVNIKATNLSGLGIMLGIQIEIL